MIKEWLTNLRDSLFGINKLQYKIVKKIKEDNDFRFRELKAMEVLKPYFPNDFVFETGYSLSFQTIQHIANDIVVYKPQTILEIGSGLSTVILNNLISKLDYNPEFISIDQDSEWQNHLKSNCGNTKLFDFQITSNNEFSYNGNGQWFNIPIESELRQKKYDLVIIDGPKGAESKYARFGIVKFLIGKLTESSIVILDDTDREDERFILKELIETHSLFHCSTFLRYTRLSSINQILTSPS